MTNRRSSTAYRNSSTSSIIITKLAAPPNPIKAPLVATPSPPPSPPPPPPTQLPQLPLSRFDPAKFPQRSQSGIGKAEYCHIQQSPAAASQLPLSHSESTKFTRTQSGIGKPEYGHNQQLPIPIAASQLPLSRTESTKFTRRTQSGIGKPEYGHNQQLPVAASQLPVSQSESTKFTRRSQSGFGKTEHDHNQQLPSQKKSQPAIDYYPFPQSPDLDDLGLGKGITSLNHDPQHRLVQVNLPSPFTCMGCKEYGAGTRFSCKQCNFELHDFCALAPPFLKAHPLHSQHLLVFNTKPGKGLLKPTCDVCGKAEKGYMFKCSACSFQLHPCCAMFSPKMNFPTHPHPLIISPATATLSGDIQCAECRRKRSGQVYRCTVCDYYLHAVCAKSLVNGLHVNGLKGLADKGGGHRVIGVAAKLASHVIIGFMGGIVEGIGEGLGEVITQNLAKGRCDSAKRGPHISG